MSHQCPAPQRVGAGEELSAQNAVADGPVTHLRLPAKQRPDTEHGLRIAGAAQFLRVGFLQFQDADFRCFVDHDVHLLVHAPTVRSDCTYRGYPGLNIGRDNAFNCNGFMKGNTMDSSILILLIAQGLCFALWTGLSFRAVFQIRVIAASRSGQMFPGPVSFLSAMGVWLKDPAHRLTRGLWALSLLGIMAPSLVIAFGPGGVE